MSPWPPRARRVTRATSNECLPTAVRDYPQLPASTLHKRTEANCPPLVVMVFLSSGGQSSGWVPAGGICCRSPRSKSPEVLRWRNAKRGSCCYFPDSCPHCAAGQLQWPARCHLGCAETVTHGRGPAEEGRAGIEEREGPAATTSLCTLSFLAGIKLHMVTCTDGSSGLGGSCSSVKSVGCSIVMPLLPYTPIFLVFLSPAKSRGGAL